MKIHTLNEYLRNRYGEKIYRLSLQSGCTCPNRDGTRGTGGCTFCSEGGSGEFASGLSPLDVQIEEAKRLIGKKTGASRFIAYFQSYSNTYGDPERLRKLYMEAAERDDIVTVSIATRPDCITERMYEVLAEVNSVKPLWVELGLQTSDDGTAERINRCFRTEEFTCCYQRLKSLGIDVIAHVILGLPGEDEEKMLATISYLSSLQPELDGIKIHLLQILKGTRLGEEYLKAPYPLMSLEQYGELLIKCMKLLPEHTVVHRMTGDGPKKLLIGPEWCADKKRVLNYLNRVIEEA
jgi:hypothetical protein